MEGRLAKPMSTVDVSRGSRRAGAHELRWLVQTMALFAARPWGPASRLAIPAPPVGLRNAMVREDSPGEFRRNILRDILSRRAIAEGEIDGGRSNAWLPSRCPMDHGDNLTNLHSEHLRLGQLESLFHLLSLQLPNAEWRDRDALQSPK